jgi:hypothetical protein
VSVCAFCFCRLIGTLETNRFSSLQLQELSMRNKTRTNSAALLSTPSSNLRSATSLPRPPALRINLNIDGAPIASRRAHTHPSRSQTSGLLFTFLSLAQVPPSPAAPAEEGGTWAKALGEALCARLCHPQALDLSLSPHRHHFLYIPPSSRFIRYH